MPMAIMPIDRARPRQDSVVIVLNARSVAISEIVFMVPPFVGPRTGVEGTILRTENFMPTFRASLIKWQCQRERQVKVAQPGMLQARDQRRVGPSTLAMVEAVMAARSEATWAASRSLARSSIKML